MYLWKTRERKVAWNEHEKRRRWKASVTTIQEKSTQNIQKYIKNQCENKITNINNRIARGVTRHIAEVLRSCHWWLCAHHHLYYIIKLAGEHSARHHFSVLWMGRLQLLLTYRHHSNIRGSQSSESLISLPPSSRHPISGQVEFADICMYTHPFFFLSRRNRRRKFSQFNTIWHAHVEHVHRIHTRTRHTHTRTPILIMHNDTKYMFEVFLCNDSRVFLQSTE